VFGSDICTCRPYLIFGIEEAVKGPSQSSSNNLGLLTYWIEAQKGGSGVVIYFRKEGRALGEVTKVNATWGFHRSSATYIVIPLQSIMHIAPPTPNPHSSGYPTANLHTRSHPLIPNIPLSFRRLPTNSAL